MKIEKINDRQICCIITSQDLINNQIKLSELAFGSNKARAFFRNLMMKARTDCGFDGLNSPLMIEAMPQPPDALKLIITKMAENVSAPEEPHTEENRFELHFSGADEVLNLFKSLKEKKEQSARPNAQTASAADLFAAFGAAESLTADPLVIEAFRFSTLDNVILAAKALKDFYDGENSLYYEPAQRTYLLTVRCVTETPEEFNKICNMLTEYAIPVHCSESGEHYLREQGNEMIADNAMQVLTRF